MNRFKTLRPIQFGIFSALALTTTSISAADPITGNVSVRNSMCVGFSCVDSETFADEQIQLKSSNLRILFNDISSPTGSFASNDWRIMINDSTIGGDSFFAIDDVTSESTPVKILAGAPTNSLFINNAGDIGFGTSMPTDELHVISGNTPALRLDQDSSSGFAAQAWVVGGNETSFFIESDSSDTTPLSIIASAPNNSLFIANDGSIGMGTNNPSSGLHLSRNDGTTQLLVQETNAIGSPRTLFRLENKGNTKFEMRDTSNPGDPDPWAFASTADDFRVSKQNSGAVEFRVDTQGNAVLAGVLTENSDRAGKRHIVELDPSEVLEKLAGLPVQQWQYKDTPGVNHVGPMAQDFHAAFGLGASSTGISTIDTAGISLAAIKALINENEKLHAANAHLQLSNSNLQERVSTLESSQQAIEVLMKDILSKQGSGYLQAKYQAE